MILTVNNNSYQNSNYLNSKFTKFRYNNLVDTMNVAFIQFMNFKYTSIYKILKSKTATTQHVSTLSKL